MGQLRLCQHKWKHLTNDPWILKTINGLQLVFFEEKDFLFTVDLTDAYFSVSIQPEFRKFFRFSWMGQLYEFLVMCFGLTTAPFIFTKITRPILVFLHSRGIRASMYIDDCISAVKTFSQALTVKDTVVNLLQEVGFVINFESHLLYPLSKRFIWVF